MSQPQKKPFPVHKWILGTLGLAVVGAGGLLAVQAMRNRNPGPPPQEALPAAPTNPALPFAPPSGDAFPLGPGSRGPRVQQVQRALIAKLGPQALPKYGVDGTWGSETTSAAKRAGWKVPISATSFASLIGTTAVSPSTLARDLAGAITAKRWEQADQSLAQIPDTDTYRAVGDRFRLIRIQGIRYSPVTALLRYFPSHKSRLEAHFSRMGLVQQGGQWTYPNLQGVLTLHT